MFCTSCGASVDDGLIFCSQCGSNLRQNNQPQSSYQPMEDHPTELFSGVDVNPPAESFAPSDNVYQSVEPIYNQAPPAYQGVQPAYNQYQNVPMYNMPTYSQPSYNQYTPFDPPKRNTGKVPGILSLIFSLVGYPMLLAYFMGIVFWFAAFILGIVGIVASKKNGYSNGRAVAGLIISLLPMILVVIGGVIGLVGILVFGTM